MGSQLRVCVAIFSVLLLAELSFCRMYSTYRSLTKKLRPRKTSVNTRKFPVHHRGKLQNQGKYGKYRMSDDEAEPHEVLWQKAQRRKMKRHHYKAPREDPSDGLDDISILEVKQSRIEDQTFQCLNKALKSTATEPMPPPDLGAGSPANNPGIDSTLLSEDTGDLQLTSDIQTMLYQYLNLPSNIAGEINSCMINMAPSQRRCEVIYGTDQCEPVRRGHTKHFTYWAKRCPNKYLRYGCCKCVLACESDSLVGEPEGVSNLFCVKKGQYEIPTSEGFVVRIF